MFFIENFEKKYKSIDDIQYVIPEIQRRVEPDNIKKIYAFQKEYYNKKGEYCLNGSISIGRDLFTGIDYLLDGQHRMAAYTKLRSDFPEKSMIITVDTFDCSSIKNIELTYEYINTHNPNPITKLGLDDYKILQSFGDLMEKQFKSYLKNTKKPQRPNINLTNLKDAIKEKKLIEKCNTYGGSTHIKSGVDLFQYILSINKYYCNLEHIQFSKWGINDYLKIIDKINKHENKLFLSLFSNFEWIDRLIEHITLTKPFNSLKHISNSWRPVITKTLRKAVWLNTNDSDLRGNCYCCENFIEFDNFVCGHIIPVSIGGETNISNMKAICAPCNLNMGIMNLDKYKKLLSAQLDQSN
jgi:hypothetical protein